MTYFRIENKNKLVLFTIILFAQNVLALSESSGNWRALFDGSHLESWIRLGGDADYIIENKAIVGISKHATPNTFLATKKKYGDFILELDINVDSQLNSGIQIRSLTNKKYRNGRVHGYQFEIDPSPRAFTGGIYDEGRRGWLYPLSRNPKGRSAFKNGTWNSVHIEAVGASIRTWVNGIQTANLVDDRTREGFIALQVHSLKSTEPSGSKVKWKNIRILTEALEDHRWPVDPDVPEISYLQNTLTQQEKNTGWRLLWDGKTNRGWRGVKLNYFPRAGWKMRDGILTIKGSDGRESGGAGDIVTKETFASFEMQLEFQLTKGANSGIKYFVKPALNTGDGSAIGSEFQLLDDINHPDAKQGVAGNRTLGSLYDLIPADNLSIPGRSKQFKGLGTWNHARIVVKNGLVEHWLNHEKVVEYDRHSQMFAALVSKSKYTPWKGFGQWPRGHILLQDHGDTVHFKNIKIREF